MPMSPQPPNAGVAILPPQGGPRAWLVVLGGFLLVLVSFGWLNCIGVFQEYYETHQLQEYSSSEVSWITSIQTFILMGGTVLFGLIFDTYGPLPLLISGTIIHPLGLIFTSLSTEYYQFLLSQGVLSALGCAALMSCANASVSTWFTPQHHQALALGIVVSGSSVGGVVVPLMIRGTLPRIGFAWTMRCVALVYLILCIIALRLVRVRGIRQQRRIRVSDFLSPWQEQVFVVTVLGAGAYGFGLFAPLNYIESVMTHYDIAEGVSANAVSILNGASFFGRILLPLLSDRIGRYNAIILIALATSTILLAIWIPVRSSTPGTLIFTLLFGFFSGAFTALSPAVIVQISPPEQYGTRIGIMFAVSGIAGLIASPLGGVLVQSQGGCPSFMGFVGGMTALSVGLYGFARGLSGGWKWTKI